MVLQFALVYIILILWPIYLLSLSSSAPIVGQPGCVWTCGDVEIPYPFGMNDPKCYVDNWFEIECRNNTPVLKSFNLEISFMYEHMVRIKNPVYHWNCPNKNDAERVIGLRGSPFVYSQDRNRFVAIGCNQLVLLASNGSQVGGCVSICEDKERTHIDMERGGCHGRYCCQTSLSKYLPEYNASLYIIPNDFVKVAVLTNNNCSYALIGDEDWLNSGFNYPKNERENLNNIEHLDYVPAMLEWEILDPIKSVDQNAFCFETNITSPDKKNSGHRCECKRDFFGNPYVSGGCILIKFDDNDSSLILVVLTSVGTIIAFLMSVWWLCKICRKRRVKKWKKKYFKQNGGLLLQQGLSFGDVGFDNTKLFNLKDLEKATDHFNLNRVLGKGGQGTVYKGMLVDGKIVAVKKFKVQGSIEEFINEAVVLSQVNHRNVVKLLGFCLETQVPLLVYEFIPNGNLFQYLHAQNEEFLMTWEMHLRIATEVAGALFYLHSAASQPIYHRDIKSTNILLDEKYRAKVADFGTSRMVSIEDTHLTTLVQGTFGYLDPEYFLTGQFTEKSDVYSFGVVLVELLTGQKPISSLNTEEARSLASYFMMSMEEDRLFDILDRRIMEGEKEEKMAVAKLAKRCLELNGRKRPTMKEVTIELQGIQKLGKISNSQRNYGVEFAGIEPYQPWAALCTSTGLTLNNITSSSSETAPFSYIK